MTPREKDRQTEENMNYLEQIETGLSEKRECLQMDFPSGLMGRVPGRDNGMQGLTPGPAMAAQRTEKREEGHCRLQGA